MRQGRMAIDSLVFSQTLSELHELRDPDLTQEAKQNNWFSSEYTQRVYGDFLRMDQDRNGMLSRRELARYRNGNLTKTFLDRVFTSVQLFGNELVQVDFLFRTFLYTLTLCWQSKIKTPLSLWLGCSSVLILKTMDSLMTRQSCFS